MDKSVYNQIEKVDIMIKEMEEVLEMTHPRPWTPKEKEMIKSKIEQLKVYKQTLNNQNNE